MFGSIGMPELIIIFVIALIIFGPRKLPELGKTLGTRLAECTRASSAPRTTRSRPRPRGRPAPPAGATRDDLDEEEGPGARMSFLEHLDELRRRLVAAAVAI